MSAPLKNLENFSFFIISRQWEMGPMEPRDVGVQGPNPGRLCAFEPFFKKFRHRFSSSFIHAFHIVTFQQSVSEIIKYDINELITLTSRLYVTKN